MRSSCLLAVAAATLPAAAFGQAMAGMDMPAVSAPAPKAKAPPSPTVPDKRLPSQHKTAASRPLPADTHRDQATGAMPPMDMEPSSASASAPQSMPGMDMSAGPHLDASHDMTGMAPTASGTDLPAGNAPPPPIRHDRSADRYYGAPAMAEAEARSMGAHGGAIYHQILFNLAEYQPHRGRDGYRWDGEAWLGGDLDRLVIKSEGEGSFHAAVDTADVQALYSRAIDPYWNLRAGVRQAFLPGPNRQYAVLSVEGLAPYWLEVGGSLFLSSKGDLLARAEAYYDQRITQHLILQPRAELNFATRDVPENRIGSGLSDVELGLRLRYEIRREFAPYVGVSWERRVGDTARFTRAAGDDVRSTRLAAGIRFWF